MQTNQLVPVVAFVGESGERYQLTRPDIQAIWLLYHTFDHAAGNQIYPERVRLADVNWLMFQHGFDVFGACSLGEIESLAHEIAEEAIMYEALERMRDPVWIKEENEVTVAFFAWLAHEPDARETLQPL